MRKSHNPDCAAQRYKLLLAILPLMLATTSSAQQIAYESPGSTKFLLYTPPGYGTSNADYPLLISLHSKGEVGDDLTLLTSRNREQMPSRLIYLNRWPSHLPFVVLTPQLKAVPDDPDFQWPAEYIDEVVNYVLANFRIDDQRIYLTGISRGGTGAWTYASAFPGKIAAMVPISGRSDLAQACPLKNIPVWAFHGDGDAVAPADYSINMIKAIKACEPRGSFTPRLDLLNARDHNGWNDIYNGTSGYDIWSWLLTFKKFDATNKKPYVDAGRDLRMQLRDAPIYLYGDFFDWDGTISSVSWKQISGTALALSDQGSEFLRISEAISGTFEFQLSVTDNKGAQSTDHVRLEITSSSTAPAITQLVLVDGKTNAELGNLFDGQVIDKHALGVNEINIKAVASTETASVRFSVNSDDNVRIVNTDAFYIKPQTTYPEWQITPRTYMICATPYTGSYASGTPGISQCYKVTVTDGLTFTQCPDAGTIIREIWTGIPGLHTSSIPVNTAPTAIGDLTSFETPRNSGDNYGSRVRGYVCVPATGNYVFWIASDDNGELWLSTDEHPANKKKIASVSGWTNYREWSKYTSQQSAPINLIAGRKYYIEALYKEATGGDHLSVGWQLPDAAMERPIPGNRLIPFEGSNDPDEPALCAGGNIQQDVWFGITGWKISSIPFNSPPSTVNHLTSFETPRNIGDNYGSRIRGYVCVPSTGNYTFWISSDDTGELWLSSDKDPSNKTRIAYVAGWTRPGEWTKYSTQQSIAINLVAGRKYYIEALLKEAGGADHLSVGWSLPNGMIERPIPGHRLSPYPSADEFSTMRSRLSEGEFGLYPNPVVERDAGELYLNLPQRDRDVAMNNRIEIIGARGEVVFSKDLTCENCGDTLSFQLDDQLTPGIYLVIVLVDGKRFSRRLLVR